MGPFLRSNDTNNKIYKRIIIALLPLVIFSIYKNGYIPYINNKISFFNIFSPVFNILIGVITSFIIELLFAIINNKKLNDLSAIFPGLFLSLILPINIPKYIIIFGSVVASVCKNIFEKYGKIAFNPSLIGYLFIIVFFSSFLTKEYYLNKYELEIINLNPPLSNYNLVSKIGTYDNLVKPFGNLNNFFVGNVPGSLVGTSVLLCLISFIYLVITKTIKWRISVSYILTVFLMSFVIGQLFNQGIYYALFQIFSGSLIFGSIFIVTDFKTSTVTPIGQLLQGIILGILTVLFRNFLLGGTVMSVLITNLLVKPLDYIGARLIFNLEKLVKWFLLLWMIVILSIILIAVYRKNNSNNLNNLKLNVVNIKKSNY